MNRIRAGALTVVFSAVLAACGGGGDDAPPPRATIVTAQLAGQATKAQIDAGTSASGAQQLTGAAACDVDIRYVLYMTRDPAGQPATASEAVFVPSGTAPQCSGDRPVVLYAHGTTTAKSYNIADVSRQTANPTLFNNAAGAEGSLILAMYAAQGFIVVAPNYLGYDRSSLSYHPYLNAEAQAVDMVDGLRAAKAHLAAAGTTTKPSSKLFIAGYSQGGHVAMATHKAIERDYSSEFTVTASVPMSGPYNLVGFGDFITPADPTAATANQKVNAGATIFVPLLLTSYQKSYGNIYSKPSDVYQSPYDQSAETLFPTDTPVATLLQQGKLPADTTFTKLFGTGGLLTDSFATGYAASNYRKATVTNTLAGMDGTTPISWKPKAPIALCGGQNDPTVFYQLNTTVAQQVFATAQNVTVPAFDLENRATLPAGATGDQIYGGFQQAKTAAGSNATAQYHGSLVPPFCNALARGFFSALAQ
jgi:pimeloyl-ACP methyl ester carboxylesterase